MQESKKKAHTDVVPDSELEVCGTGLDAPGVNGARVRKRGKDLDLGSALINGLGIDSNSHESEQEVGGLHFRGWCRVDLKRALVEVGLFSEVLMGVDGSIRGCSRRAVHAWAFIFVGFLQRVINIFQQTSGLSPSLVRRALRVATKQLILR